MGGMDPSLFRIERPALEAYAASFGPSIAVERYSSAGGHMRSEGRLHRISLNRTPHRRYAFRYGPSACNPPAACWKSRATVPTMCQSTRRPTSTTISSRAALASSRVGHTR